MCRTGTHRYVMAVRPSNSPSGRMVRSLIDRYLWVSRKGDDPRNDDTIATSHVLVPYAIVYSKMTSPPRCTDDFRMHPQRQRAFAAV